MTELKTEELQDLFPEVNFNNLTQVSDVTTQVMRRQRRPTGEHDGTQFMRRVTVSLIGKLRRLLW